METNFRLIRPFVRPYGAQELVSSNPRVPSARHTADFTLGYSRLLPPGGSKMRDSVSGRRPSAGCIP